MGRLHPLLVTLLACACSSPASSPTRSPAPVIDLPCGGVEAPPSERRVELPRAPLPSEAAARERDYPLAGPEAPCTRSQALFSGSFALGSGRTHAGTITHRIVVATYATLRIDYPLSAEIAVPLVGPLRGSELLDRIRAAYQHIYEEEERVPGHYPYGIWSHGLTDLYVEGIVRCETEAGVEIRIGVGS